MQWRAPWMQGRLALFILALWDLFILSAAYSLVYFIRFNNFSHSFTLGQVVYVLLWLSGSYLLGRYSKTESGYFNSIKDAFFKTVAIAFALLLVFVLHNWINAISDAGTRFRGFLIPLITLSVAGSYLGQIFVSLQFSVSKRWILVVSKDEHIALKGDNSLGMSATLENIEIIEHNVFQQYVERKLGLNPNHDFYTIAVSENIILGRECLKSLMLLRSNGTRIRTLIDWAELNLHRIPPELVSEHWFIAAEGFSVQPGRFGWRLKRLGDLLGAFFIFVITLPLFIVSAFMIYLEDGTPVFYSQLRSGLNGELIRIWKLRTMKHNSERNGPQWSSRHDSRVTHVGKVLRKFRIDELPQLLGVIKGDLSMIGPRPERPEFETLLEQQIPHYRVRHWIRPGLSGWAQVNHPYAASIDDSRMKLSYDLYYIRNSGLFLDILIVIKTARMLLRAKGSSPAQRIVL